MQACGRSTSSGSPLVVGIDRLDLNLDFTRACRRVMAMRILAFGFIRVKTSSFSVVQMVSRCRSELARPLKFS